MDIKDRIEQSAVLIEQSSLEDNSDNDEIPDLGWISKYKHFLNELTYSIVCYTSWVNYGSLTMDVWYFCIVWNCELHFWFWNIEAKKWLN